MSTLKVANIHFEATGTNRVEYVANNINFRTGGGNFTISVGGAETLNVNASSVMISGANILASVAAAATSANLTSAWGTANAAATSANLTSAWGTANSALANTNATFAGNLTLGINQTLFVGNATVNTAISAGSITTNGVALGGGYEIVDQTFYTASQTITIPTGATKALVYLVGSGTGGGGGYWYAGGYTGAGGCAIMTFLKNLTPGNTLAFTLGTAGSGGGGVSGPSQPVNCGAAGSTTLASGTQTISTLTCPSGSSSGASGTATGGLVARSANGAYPVAWHVNVANFNGSSDRGIGGAAGVSGDGNLGGTGGTGVAGCLYIIWIK